MSVRAAILVIMYILLAPVAGGLMEGVDRKISARMQGRIGPPILQPFYDVIKLFNKQVIAIGVFQSALLLCYLVLMIFTGAIFFAGNDILMCLFVLSTASTFMYFAAVVTGSPYNTIASSRELIQIMTYEPAVLMAGVGFYLVSGTFSVSAIANNDTVMLFKMPGLFVSFVLILLVKMRKSPFDISTSHHAHQELVMGVKTEMGAHNLAIFTITEWYENSFLMGIVGLFAVTGNPLSYLGAAVLCALVFFFLILVDNASARVKWTQMIQFIWLVTFFASGVNLLVLMLIR
ncbi:MAG TPA: Ech hydrogenase subunit EchB [Lachnospiraceae bacterium]|nr:Ech hydrogenase subunit EchB [Lachnospiraceae bacterium]